MIKRELFKQNGDFLLYYLKQKNHYKKSYLQLGVYDVWNILMNFIWIHIWFEFIR